MEKGEGRVGAALGKKVDVREKPREGLDAGKKGEGRKMEANDGKI